MKETPYNLIVHWYPGSWQTERWSIGITGHQPSVSFILSYLEREKSSEDQVCIHISPQGSLTGPKDNPHSGVWSFRYASQLIVCIIETALGFEPLGSVAYHEGSHGTTSYGSSHTARYWRRTHAFTGI
jgi:hypothetical protein